jgi:hypothetical protein
MQSAGSVELSMLTAQCLAITSGIVDTCVRIMAMASACQNPACTIKISSCDAFALLVMPLHR